MNVRCVEGGCYRTSMLDARTCGCRPLMSSLTHAILDEYPSCRHVCGGTKEVGHVKADPDEGNLEPHGCRVFQGLDREDAAHVEDERISSLRGCRPAWDVLEGFIYANSVALPSSLI